MQIPDSSKPLSQRKFGELIGVSHVTVQRGIAEGRLQRSVDANGKIVDVELARQEWEQNKGLSKNAADLDGDEPSLMQASTRHKLAQAELAELKLAQEKGELVPAADVRGKLEDVFRSCRRKLEALPSRAKQALPELTAGAVQTLENLVREALEDLADNGGAQ